MPVSPARAAGFEILMRIEETEAYTSEMLHSARFAKLSTADHGLMTELVLGVLRWRSVLDGRIADFSRMPATDPHLPNAGQGGALQPIGPHSDPRLRFDL